jgi:hypothetical protein
MEHSTARKDLWAWYTPQWRHRTVLLVLFSIVFWTYRDALKHPPREDHWSYLLDTVHEERFLPLLMQTYSYNRTREVGPGDYLLFRPVLFALLSAEKALFGTNYACWQGFGIVLHCAVVWVFLRLLLRLHQLYSGGSPAINRLQLVLAYVLGLFFAVNFAGTEMVIWCHIHGYLLFVLFVLASLLLLVDELGGTCAQNRGWRLAGALVLMLLAAFTYEIGSAFAACIGVVLALVLATRGQVRRGLMLLVVFGSVLLLYRAVDWLDQRCHPNPQKDITVETVLAQAHWQPTITNARRYILFTLCQPFFPSCPSWSFENRLHIPEPDESPEVYWRPDSFLFISYAVGLTSAWVAISQLIRLLHDHRRRAGALFLLLPASLILLHLGIIVLGRMNLRSDHSPLSSNSYYAYTPFVFLLLGLYFLWVRVPLRTSGGTLVALVVVLGGVLALSWSSAGKVHALAAQIRLAYRPLRNHINCMRSLIDQHSGEPGFAISFDPQLFYELDQIHGVAELEILFCRFIDHEHPSHVICGNGEGCCALTEHEYSWRFGGPHYRELPTFVQPGTYYMLFRHNQQYYGLDFREGRFRPPGEGYCYLLKGTSVAEILRQVPAALEQHEEDCRTGRYIPCNLSATPLNTHYKGFAFFQVNGQVHAIPEDEGPLERAYLIAGRYSRWYCGPDLAAVRRCIDANDPPPAE